MAFILFAHKNWVFVFSYQLQLYLHEHSERHNRLYEALCNRLQNFLKGIATLSTEYLASAFLPASKLTLSLLPQLHGRPPPHAASFSSIDSFVLKLLLHVYMGSKCSSSLYEAFQIEDKSCKGPIYICWTSFYLLTEVKLGMIKLKTFLVHTQAWFTRTTLANPGCSDFFSSFNILSSSCANSGISSLWT